MVTIDNGIRGGAPCFRGTRTPVHMIAEMFANGDSAADLAEAYPTISEEHVHAARIYARAYPRRDPPHGGPSWRRQKPRSSIRIPFNKLPRVSRSFSSMNVSAPLWSILDDSEPLNEVLEVTLQPGRDVEVTRYDLPPR